MRSARKLLVPAAAAAALFAVSGCSDDEPAKDKPAARSSPSELAQYTAAPDTAPATQSPTTDTSTKCVKTAGMNVGQLTQYLKELPNSSGAHQSQGLTLDSDGLNFTPDPTQRPCKAVKVKLARYWVDLKQTREETAVSPARFEYEYTLIDVTSHKAGPQNGRVPDSAPAAGSDCQGSVSVVYLGDDIPLRSLPSDLELTDTTAPVPVEVNEDGVLSAIYISPVSVVSC
ncbi:hypothetical protein ACFU9Y_31455 [Streptomyces sp. NPDC057621]|uniref:hypothetical protein n=1 Tax=Streptomyces sp. NPDC057621 TaxID=3346186 RepID=UPI0036C5D95A